MRFGLFGSAQAKRGGPDVDSGVGFREFVDYNVEAESLGFCRPMEEAAERFDESLAVILKAWTSDAPWSHRGKYWQFEEVVVEPPTAQKPHPPLWMGAGSPESITKVAEQGHQLLLDQYASIEEIGE